MFARDTQLVHLCLLVRVCKGSCQLLRHYSPPYFFSFLRKLCVISSLSLFSLKILMISGGKDDRQQRLWLHYSMGWHINQGLILDEVTPAKVSGSTLPPNRLFVHICRHLSRYQSFQSIRSLFRLESISKITLSA